MAQMVGVEPTRQSPVLKHFECSLLRPLEYICIFNFVARNFPQGVISSAPSYDRLSTSAYSASCCAKQIAHIVLYQLRRGLSILRGREVGKFGGRCAGWLCHQGAAGVFVCIGGENRHKNAARGSRGGRHRAALCWMDAAKALRDQAQFFRMPKAAATRASGSSSGSRLPRMAKTTNSGSAMTKSSVAAILARPQVT